MIHGGLLTQETFADTLCTFIALFYHFKNETAEQYSDDALIAAMRHAFENTCGGATRGKCCHECRIT